MIRKTVKTAVHDIRLKFNCKNIWNVISFIIENKYDILVSNKLLTLDNNNNGISYNQQFNTNNIGIGIPDAINLQSKDIKFKSFDIKRFKIDITIHKTDTVTIIIACSYNPISLDFRGYLEFCSLLSRIEERLARLINDCSINYIKIKKEIQNLTRIRLLKIVAIKPK